MWFILCGPGICSWRCRSLERKLCHEHSCDYSSTGILPEGGTGLETRTRIYNESDRRGLPGVLVLRMARSSACAIEGNSKHLAENKYTLSSWLRLKSFLRRMEAAQCDFKFKVGSPAF